MRFWPQQTCTYTAKSRFAGVYFKEHVYAELMIPVGTKVNFYQHRGNTKIRTCDVNWAGTALSGCLSTEKYCFRPSSPDVNRASTYFRVPAELPKRRSKHIYHRRISIEVSNCISVLLQSFATPRKPRKWTKYKKKTFIFIVFVWICCIRKVRGE